MKNPSIRAALAFGIPVAVVFTLSALKPDSNYFLAAGPLCGVAGGFALGRRWAVPIVLGFCFAAVGLMFALQDARSALFSDVVWTGLVSGFLFWVCGGCAMLALPVDRRFNGAAALAIPGAVAGMVFQFLYGPGHFLFDLGGRRWWTLLRTEHLLMWLIAGAGGGWLLGSKWEDQRTGSDAKQSARNGWAVASIAVGTFGMLVGLLYFLRSSLPLGLFNSLSPASAASDWLWGWGILAASIGVIGAFRPNCRPVTVIGVALAAGLLVASYRVEANPWKSRFNTSYAAKLLQTEPQSGDAIYTANLILAQAALDNNDVPAAKRFLLEAAQTSGARRIQQNGLDVSVARALFDRGEKETVLLYLQRGRTLWPEGSQIITRWEAAIRAGRRPNFNTRGPAGAGNPQTTNQ
jgi:hypothetical protein